MHCATVYPTICSDSIDWRRSDALLGMHLIVCTQNPMGQVHADMKANISLSICLRVTDQMQSNELIGTKDAALIPPAFPGAAYCHDGQRTVPFRCSAVHDIDSLVHAINTASAFSGTTNPSPLFSAPLAPHAGKDDLTAPQREDGTMCLLL